MSKHRESLVALRSRMTPVADALAQAAEEVATARMDSVAERYPSAVTTPLDDLTVRALALADDARGLVDTLDALTMDP